MPQKRCIVIGAGLAGLSAAYRLGQRGWKVEVFEAQDRLGGRVLSYRFEDAPHLVCELGAEWIGTSHKTLIRLCRKFQLEPEPHTYSTSFWLNRLSKKVCKPDDPTLPPASDRKYERFLEAFRRSTLSERRALDRYDWWTQLRRIGLTPDDLNQRELEDGTDFGESIRMTSAFVAATDYASSNFTDELDYKVPNGNDSLIGALASAIGADNIHTETEVFEVSQDEDEVRVRARNPTSRRGRMTRRADACICAVPATRLRHIHWHPAPEVQLDAALQLQYSRITKTAVLYGRRFWPRRRGSGFGIFTTGAADFCFDSTYRTRRGPGILCSYSVGEKAGSVLTNEATSHLAEWISQDVLRGLGRRQRKVPGTVERKPWHQDEWAGGAYAFYRPGQWFSVRSALLEPHGRVHFAGEHLSEDQGFMEGAVKSGYATADVIIGR